ncbi:MAG: aminotransferase class V-fold PLP-dependent enzyme [Anaerolineae bacterium]|nr:aminotransferase class V-fold PLP-dependent enzyme [Anaerolineae bacterium]
MDITELSETVLTKINSPRVTTVFEKVAQRIPAVRRQIESSYDDIMGDLEADLKPYREEFPEFGRIPADGVAHDDILSWMNAFNQREEARWQDGFVSGAVYNGDQAHIDFLNEIYALNSQSNPLHADVWPSGTKFEAEIVAMTANMLGAQAVTSDRPEDQICGTVSSGGTESIMLAMRTYRDWARHTRGIKKPEMIAPVTAHVAFDKAADYFGIRMKKIPVDASYRADIKAVKKAITRNTIALVGSAPAFPHGTIDPIVELSELAREQGIGFHTDACLGGFVLPWAEKLGYPVPPYDFRLPGVTSMSADTHKYGYAAKGTSVVLYRGLELRRYQYFTATDWPGGLYFSPTFAGSRPGALSAACWASLVSMGEAGYLDATRKILESADKIREGIECIPELTVLGDPLWVIAFASPTLDIYRVLDEMSTRGWSLNGLHKPVAVHIAVTLRHTQPGVPERFLADLQASVEAVKANPEAGGGMAPVYGMAATMPMRGMVGELLRRYIDVLYKV